MGRRKVSVYLFVVVAFVAVFCGCSKKSSNPSVASQVESSVKASTPSVVNIGVQTLVTPELLARYEGIYEEYLGCKVNLLQFDSGADVNRAFASGSIDIGAIGSSPAAIGISTNLGYEVIWFYDVIGTAESLVVQQNSGISSIKDLVGKKVATPFASTAHFSLQNALALNGIDPSTVELYNMQPDDIYAAWIRGDIDAAYVWDPVLTKLYENNGIAITSSAELADKGIVTADLCVVNKKFAEMYPDIVTGYIKAQIYAVNKFENEREAALTTIANAIDITRDDAEIQAKGFIYPNGHEQLSESFFGEDGNGGKIAQILKQASDFLVEQGSIDFSPELSVFEQYSTGEFIERALNEE